MTGTHHATTCLGSPCTANTPSWWNQSSRSTSTRSIWKPRHSAFYETALGYLLGSHDIERVVLTGQVTEQCILYSALDAYIRHLDIVVPEDAVVPIHPHLADAALEMVRRNMRAETPAAGDVELYSAPTR